jgi:hypothetical protein
MCERERERFRCHSAHSPSFRPPSPLSPISHPADHGFQRTQCSGYTQTNTASQPWVTKTSIQTDRGEHYILVSMWLFTVENVMCELFGFSVNDTLISAYTIKAPPLPVVAPQPITLASNAIRTYERPIQSPHIQPTLVKTLTNNPYRICRKYTALLESKSTSGSISESDRQLDPSKKNDMTAPYHSLLAADA